METTRGAVALDGGIGRGWGKKGGECLPFFVGGVLFAKRAQRTVWC